MGCFWGRWVTIAGRPVCVENKGIRAIVGTAVFLVVAGVAGGGAGSAAGSGAADEFRVGARTSRSSAPGARTNATSDSLRVTIRLQRTGRHRPTIRTSLDDSDCLSHSYGEAHQFFRANKCQSLTRMLVESPSKNNTLLIATATVDMPDYTSAINLEKVLDRQGGGITVLSRESGKYRNISFAPALYKSTRHGTTVITVQAQPVGRTPDAVIIDAIITDVLFNLGASGSY